MEKTTGRLEAFSDGIFSVAITLLALEIGIKAYPGATNANLWQRILADWPAYFAYFNSFATILLIWMGHRNILRYLRQANHPIMLLNGLGLFFVVLFPFPTRLVASFLGTGAQATAVAVYAGFTGLLTGSMWLLTRCLLHYPRLLASPANAVAWLKPLTRYQLAGFLAYEATAGLALYYPTPALVLTFLMWVFWAVVNRDDAQEN